MTANPEAVPNVPTDVSGPDLERLHVAAQSVLEWVSEGGPPGLADNQLYQVKHHAQALVDLPGVAASPFAAVRAHALRVRNELIMLATERALTIAVWFDDALGLGSPGRGAITTDPAEDPGGTGTPRSTADRQTTISEVHEHQEQGEEQ